MVASTAPRRDQPSRRDALEVLRVIRASGSTVASHLRKRAQRPGERRLATPSRSTRRRDLRRRHAAFAPPLDRAEKVGLVRPDTTTAVAYARQQEQAHPVVLPAAQCLV